jgi:ABC-type branched-subunit amino acid transport system ATPase component
LKTCATHFFIANMIARTERALLELHHVSLAFGGLQAVERVSFAVPQGMVKAVIGPNGAGKTTLFHLVSGFLAPQQGRIVFRGDEIQGLPAHVIARRGVARTFQLVQLFEHLTVLENVMVGRHRLSRAGLLAGALQLPRTRAEEQDIRDRALKTLEFVGLADRAEQSAAILPLGLKRLLEIARALATDPTLLLLDEPASGLDAVETEKLKDMILALRERGLTILLVEHDMGLTMEVADEIAVLNYGKLIAEGPPRAIQKNPEVIAAYLGTDWQA